MTVAIIGGGAAGLMAAAVLKKQKIPFTLFERESRVGKKLLATGNGRCNLTNTELDISRYHGDRGFARHALEEFNQYSLMAFLSQIGIPCTAEADGTKVFPRSLQASSVLDMFRLLIGDALTETEVLSVTPGKRFTVKTNKGEQKFDKVIFACGGRAAKKLSGGGSYPLLTDLGYKMTPLSPAIVQLKCEGTKPLEGIKIDAEVSVGDRRELGEVLFTSYGLSGPPILQVSRDAKGKELSLDLIPDMNFKEVTELLTERRALNYLTLENLFTGFLHKKIGQYLVKRAEVLPLGRSITSLTDREIKKITSCAKSLSFTVTDTNGFDNAQVTAGGIVCQDFDPMTMESKRHKGLYAVGEMLDVDGDCGGFNLQWAFSSAYAAASHIGGGL